MSEGDNGDEASQATWNQYRRLLTSELRRLNVSLIDLDHKIDLLRNVEISRMQVQIALIKQQTGIIGATAGVITSAAVALLIAFVKGH